MKNKELYEQDLKNLLSQTNEKLQQEEDKLFTAKAFELLKNKIADYIADLVIESKRNSNRLKDEAIMISHVEKASNYLTSKKRGVGNQLLGTIGGVFLGATMSNILGLVINEGDVTITGLILVTVFAVTGTFMVSISLLGK